MNYENSIMNKVLLSQDNRPGLFSFLPVPEHLYFLTGLQEAICPCSDKISHPEPRVIERHPVSASCPVLFTILVTPVCPFYIELLFKFAQTVTEQLQRG